MRQLFSLDVFIRRGFRQWRDVPGCSDHDSWGWVAISTVMGLSLQTGRSGSHSDFFFIFPSPEMRPSGSMGDVVQTEEMAGFARLVLCALSRSGSCRPAWHLFDASFAFHDHYQFPTPVIPGLHEELYGGGPGCAKTLKPNNTWKLLAVSPQGDFSEKLLHGNAPQPGQRPFQQEQSVSVMQR